LDRWAGLGLGWRWVFPGLGLVAGLIVARWPGACRRLAGRVGTAVRRPPVRLAVALASVPMFWLASNRQPNPDGSLFEQKFVAAAGHTGAFTTYDELLELYLHSRLWAVVHPVWGWDVATTYRVVSCVAGGVAVFVGLGLARRFPPTRGPLVVAGLFAGGWVLVFFGDVENYTLTNVVVLGYLVAALRFLDDEQSPLWPVGVLLGTAVTFHLQALTLGPSLLVLAGIAVRRNRRRDAVATLAAVPLLLAAVVGWLAVHGLPSSGLATSQITAGGGHWSRFVAPADGRYFWLQLQLLVLLAPAVLLVPVLLVRGMAAVGRARMVFLAVAAAGPLLMMALWRAQLGAYDDWNLYAIVAQPVGLVVFVGLAGQPRLARQAPWLTALIVLAATQAGAWIGSHTIPAP
jgi:hypothetical protein